MKKILLITAAVILVFIGGIFILMAPAMKAMSKMDVINIDRNLTIFTGGGGNSAVYVSPDKASIIIVDTKMGKGAKKIKAYVDSINPGAAVTVINTHAHMDHTGGNKLFPNAAFITGGSQNMEKSGLKWTLLKAGQTLEIKTADDVIELRDMGAAHSFADTTVYFKKRKLLMTGDLVFNGWHTVLVKQGGADIAAWIKCLDCLMQYRDIKTVVPGHGGITDAGILSAQKTYFTEISAARSDPAKLKTLREKYKSYNHVPLFSGFDETVRFMKKYM